MRVMSISMKPFGSRLWLAFAPLVLACNSTGSDIDPEEHAAEVESWHSRRVESLKRPDSWFSLVGLYWLDEGSSSFGSDSSNAVVFPPKAPPRIGSLVRTENRVEMIVNEGVTVLRDGQPVRTMTMAAPDLNEQVQVQLGSLKWFVIERGENLVGIRLRDTEDPAIEAFDGIEMFPISLDWRLPAKFDRYDPPKLIRIPNVIGTVSMQPSPGAAVFEVGGEEVRLDVTGDPNGERFSIVFGDATNGYETYGGGRFLTVNAPDDRGNMFVDFNRATNPPCAFTAFATCPLPPRQNILRVRIEAGEMSYGKNGH